MDTMCERVPRMNRPIRMGDRRVTEAPARHETSGVQVTAATIEPGCDYSRRRHHSQAVAHREHGRTGDDQVDGDACELIRRSISLEAKRSRCARPARRIIPCGCPDGHIDNLPTAVPVGRGLPPPGFAGEPRRTAGPRRGLGGTKLISATTSPMSTPRSRPSARATERRARVGREIFMPDEVRDHRRDTSSWNA
jgi:hypothetical protein